MKKKGEEKLLCKESEVTVRRRKGASASAATAASRGSPILPSPKALSSLPSTSTMSLLTASFKRLALSTSSRPSCCATSLPLRQFSSSSSSTSSSSTSSSYPYSATAQVIPSTTTTTTTTTTPTFPLNDSLLRTLNQHLTSQHALATRYSSLLSRRSPTRLLPGSVLTVTSYTSLPTTENPTPTTNTFSGVLIAIRRRHQGRDSSIRLRNLVGRTGVEISYKVFSPMLKDIKVVAPATRSGPPILAKDGSQLQRKKPTLRASKRAKMYFVRDQPNRSVFFLSSISSRGLQGYNASSLGGETQTDPILYSFAALETTGSSEWEVSSNKQGRGKLNSRSADGSWHGVHKELQVARWMDHR